MICLVCTKHVPDSSGPRGFVDGRLDRTGSTGVLSELDEYGVEAAIRLRESGDVDQVIAVTMGDADADHGLTKALQMGADRAVHVRDDRLRGADALATSAVIAAVARRERADLVILGTASTDAMMGVLAPMVAERLGIAHVSHVSALEMTPGALRARRENDRHVEWLDAPLPLVISVSEAAGEPRYPTFKDVMSAKRARRDVVDLDDLGLEPSQVTAAMVVEGLEPVPPRTRGVVLNDADASAVVAFLVEKGLVPA